MADVIIDTAAIHDLLNVFMNSDDIRKQCREYSEADTRQNAIDAGNKFLQVLVRAIESSGLSPEAEDAVMGWDLSDVYELVNGDMCISAMVYEDPHRESLWQEGYPEGLDDIVTLLNDGYTAGDRVYGAWHGSDLIASRTAFDGAHFIEQAVDNFKGNYGSDYNVVSVIIGN